MAKTTWTSCICNRAPIKSGTEKCWECRRDEFIAAVDQLKAKLRREFTAHWRLLVAVYFAVSLGVLVGSVMNVNFYR